MNTKLISDYLEKAASAFPHKEALIYKEQRLTYAECWLAVNNLARGFLKLGVKKGDRIAVIMPNSPEYLYTYMAASLVGAVVVGINPVYKGPEIASILNSSLPKALIMFDKHRQNDYQKIIREHIFPGVIPNIIIHDTQQKNKFLIRNALRFSDILSQDNGVDDKALAERKATLGPDDKILVIYTSGTTARPKGAALTHKNIISSTAIEEGQWGLSSTDRILLSLHMSHIGAAEVSVAGMHHAATLVMMDHFNPVEALSLIETEKITFMGQVPTAFAMMLNVNDFEKYDLSSLRLCMLAGAPLLPGILERMAGSGMGQLMVGYGMAETAGIVSYTSTDDFLETLRDTVGKPSSRITIKIVDENRQELPPGEIGEIAIRGDCILKEYYELPAETEQAIDKEGWFYTGDMGVFNEAGYLILKGRKEDIIMTSGFCVFPQEVEEKLMQHPQIQSAAVLGVPDPVHGEIGRAFIVPADGKVFKQSELISYMEEILADFKIPRQFSFRQFLPLTPTGKVEKRILQEEIYNEG
ncbi:MAG: AMP-binding protein [Bacillota bacterium]